jgi:hypothetical protein
MNSKILLTTIIVTSLVFTSCKKELEPQESTPTSELVKLGLAKDTAKTQSVVQMPATNPNTVLSSNAGLNPAHGQPGHRCDIAVGAPLNSAPTQQAQTTQTVQQVQANTKQQQVVTTTVAPPVKVGKGMNPSHGQPGHRCDIPVGAPLNSPPAAKPVANTTESGSTSKTFTVTPPANSVPSLLSTEEVATADGMNPAHGKPGHRCDIAVGAPLPKS